MTNPFDELGDLDEAFAAIDEDVERRIEREEFRKRCSPGGSTYEELARVDADEWEIIPPVGEGAPVGRALLLTQQEWDDLCEMVRHYRMATRWADGPPRYLDETSEHIADLKRHRALAERIIEANQ